MSEKVENKENETIVKTTVDKKKQTNTTTSKEKLTNKNTTKTTKSSKEPSKRKTESKKVENNRFTDVIEKMEEETKKVEKNKEVKTKKKKAVNSNSTAQTKKSATKQKETNNKTKTIKKENKSELVEAKKTKVNLPIEKQEELEIVEEEIREQTKLPKEKMSKIYFKVFKNILFAIIVLIYFIFINMGYSSIMPNVFITDLKVFSITCIIITICTFEYAYKKDSGKYAINGIELLFLSICTLLSIRIYAVYNNKFVSAITSFALLFAIYYVVKATIIYVKEKKELKKQVNSIYKTAKREMR